MSFHVHVSMFCYKDSPEMFLSFVVTALWIASTSSEDFTLNLIKEKSHTKQDQEIRKVFSVRWCSSVSEFSGCYAHPVMLFDGDSLLDTVLFHIQLTCDLSNSQLTINTHHQRYPLNVDLSPYWWKPPASGVIFHFLVRFFEPFLPHKNTFARLGVLSIDWLKKFRMLVMEFIFSDGTKIFMFIRFSLLIAERHEKEKL